MKLKTLTTYYLLLTTKFKLPPQTSRLWPALIALALLATLVVYLATQPFALQVASTNPTDKTPDMTLDGRITAIFNRPVPASDQSAVRFALAPLIAGQISFNDDGTQAIFSPQKNYQDNADYTVTITGRNLKTHTFTFHTRTISSATFSPFTSPLANPTPAGPNDPKQKLLGKLPHYDPNYLIEYTVARDIIYISIWNQPIDKYQQSALDWIKTFGFPDPQKELNIKFNIPRNLIPESATNTAP